jgi:hypothetical protein
MIFFCSCDDIIDSSTSSKFTVYNATSNTAEGLKAIDSYDIRYISPKVYAFLWTDLYRTDGFFAMNVKQYTDNDIRQKITENDTVNVIVAAGTVYYSKLSLEQSSQLQLTPKFNVWQSFGSWILGAIILGVIFFYFIKVK